MLDIKFIRENPDIVKDGARKKHFDIDVDKLLEVDGKSRTLIFKGDELKAQMNKKAKAVSMAPPEERPILGAALKSLKEEIKASSEELNKIDEVYNDLMLRTPNIPDPETPEGKDDEANVEIRREGNIPEFDFPPLDHIELGKRLDLVDIERGAMIAGSRNYILKGAGEMLQRAVLSLAMDHMLKKGFIPMQVPVLVKDFSMVGTGFYPSGEDQVYRTEKEGLNLIGTAEVPVTSYHCNDMLSEDDLPLCYIAQSTCFRREAGAAGKDTKGLYRVHQFQKIEQVVISKNDRALSEKMHHSILKNAEEFMVMLGLPYRVVCVCGGDLGLPQALKYDIETWMPSRESYGETHSASKFYDFQARRLKIRYKDNKKRTHYCHTLNNTVVASPRILIPLMETYQNSDGSITVPEILRQYMGGMEKIKA